MSTKTTRIAPLPVPFPTHAPPAVWAKAGVLALACIAPLTPAISAPCDTPLFITKVQYTTGLDPSAIAVADVDGNSLPDVVTAHNGAGDDVNIIYQVSPDVFSSPIQLISTSGTDVFAVAVGQFDGNGLPDVLAVTARRSASDPAELLIALQSAPGSFFPPFKIDAFPDDLNDLVLADFDGDGKLDAAACSEFSGDEDIVVFWGSGQGFPKSLSVFEGPNISSSIDARDINGDGLIDLLVSDVGGAGKIDVFFNLGTATRDFAHSGIPLDNPVSPGTPPVPTRVTTGDVDDDGDPDLIVSLSQPGAVVALINDGSPIPEFTQQVTLATGVGGDWVEAGTIDSDSTDDIVVLDRPGYRATLLAGLGDGTFCELGEETGMRLPQRCTIVDIDDDQDNDIAIAADTSGSGSVFVLYNGGSRDCNDNQIPDDDETFVNASWNQAAGGGYDDENSWCPIELPGPDSLVNFDLPGVMYDVILTDETCAVTSNGICIERLHVINGFPRFVAASGTTPEIFVGDNTSATNGGVDGDISVGLRNGIPASLEIAGAKVFAGALVGTDSIHIAVPPGTRGDVRVTGANSLLESSRSVIRIGTGGIGSLTVDSGGRVDCRTMILGDPNDLPLTGGTLDIIGIGSAVDVEETLTLEQGAIRIHENAELIGGLVSVQGGAVIGNGLIRAVVNNRATVEPGDPLGSPIGTLTVQSNYVQHDGTNEDTGRLIIDIQGTAPGEADALIVQAVARLAGSLTVQAAGSLDDLTASSPPIEFLNANTIEGQFDVALLPGLPDGRFFRLAYDRQGPSSVSLLVDTLGDELGFGDQQTDNVPTSGSPSAATLADMNNDALLDLVIVFPDGTNAGTLLVLFNAGNDPGTGEWIGFGSANLTTVGVDPVALAVGDLDNDGAPDVAVANHGDDTVTIALNTGNGTLDPIDSPIQFGHTPTAIVIGDIDSDTFQDVLVAGVLPNLSGALRVGLNAGVSGQDWLGLDIDPRQFGIGPGASFMDIGDFDNDNCLDILVTSEDDGGVYALENTEPDQGGWDGFEPSLFIETGSSPITAAIGDLDNDTYTDFIVADLDTGLLSVILGEGTAPGVFAFRSPADIPVGQNPRSLVIADLDSDGDNDIAALTDNQAGSEREIRLLRNDIDETPGAQLQLAPAVPIDADREPLILLAGDVDLEKGQDLVAITGDPQESGTSRGPVIPADIETSLNLADPSCNIADLVKPFGTLDLADITAFVTAFSTGDPAGDLAEPFGLFDLADITAFVSAFSTGCP
jgi:T5SS/PEP-CTERM-associated repeat protein